MLPPGGRPYKSRKARPCDLCRGRKVACRMDTGPPCQLCKERQGICTFVQAPGKRKRPGTDADTILVVESSSGPGDIETEGPPDGSPAQPRSVDGDIVLPECDDALSRPVLAGPDKDAVSAGVSEAGITPSNTFRSDLSSRTSETHRASPSYAGASRSLEALPGVSYRAIGSSGDLDLYVLSQRSYDMNNESSVQYRGLRYRRMPLDASGALSGAPCPAQAEPSCVPPPVFMIIENGFTAQSEPRLDKQTVDRVKAELAALTSPELGYRLTLLYSHFVHPHFPILFSHQLPRNLDDVLAMSPSLLAAICATAIPFMVYDDVLSVRLPDYPSAEQLFRLAWILINEELHAPRLSTIQTCLLLLQRHDSNRYVPSTPFRPALMSTTVALCHCLGLHRDPSQWTTLPRWERQLRRRIWWATWTMEKWISLGESLPSALRDDEFDVGPLTREDLEQSFPQALDSEEQPSHFVHLVTLTNILGEVMEAFFTVRASARTSTSLELSLDVARPLRAKLKQWHDTLPPDVKGQISQITERGNSTGTRQLNPSSFCRLNASASFYVSYLTVQLSLLRALLRPVTALATQFVDAGAVDDADSDDDVYVPGRDIPVEQKEGAKAVIKGAMAFVKEAVEFVENLGGSEWDAFWHSWSRTNLAIVGGVMLNLLVILRPPVSPTTTTEVVSSTPSQAPSLQQGHDEHLHVKPRELNTNSFLDLQLEYRTLLDYVTRWRWAMKVSSRGAGGQKGLMNLSLMRMDALLAELSYYTPIDNVGEGMLRGGSVSLHG